MSREAWRKEGSAEKLHHPGKAGGWGGSSSHLGVSSSSTSILDAYVLFIVSINYTICAGDVRHV